MKEEWLFPGAMVPVDRETTLALVAEIKRLIDVVGGLVLKQGPDYERGFVDGMSKQAQSSVDKAVNAMAQPAPPPPECKTEAEQTAYAFGWWKALESMRAEPDWKDLYEKQKRRAEMWIAKYEKDIGPLEKAAPVAQEPRNFCPRCGKRRGGDVNYIHTCTPPEGGHQ